MVDGGTDPLAPAQLGNALFVPQALQHDADLLFCRELLPGGPPDAFFVGPDVGFIFAPR
jgi:hypothetical protein